VQSAQKAWLPNAQSLCECASKACSSTYFFNGGTKPVDWQYTLGFYAVGNLGVITFDGRWYLQRLLDPSAGDADFKAAVSAGLRNMKALGVLDNVWFISHWNAGGEGGGSSSVDGRTSLLRFASVEGIGEYSASTWYAFSGHAHTNSKQDDTSYCIGGNGQSWGASPVGCGCASRMEFDSGRKTAIDFTSPGGKCATHCTTTR